MLLRCILTTNYFTVKENGKIGIGTDEPEQVLHVKGNKMLVEQSGNKSLSDIHKTIEEDSIEKESMYSCFPNPVTNQLNICVEEFGKIEILNIFGNSLFLANIELGTSYIDMSNYKSGLYVIKFKFGRKIIIKKIMKL